MVPDTFIFLLSFNLRVLNFAKIRGCISRVLIFAVQGENVNESVCQRTRKYWIDTKAWLNLTTRCLLMENLMTVPQEIWLIYRLKVTVNQRKRASRKQDQKDLFRGRGSDSFNSKPLPTNP